jgi:hypothetical protein
VPQEEQHGGGALLIRCDNPQCVKHFDNLEMWKGAQGQPTTNTKAKAKTSSAAKLKDQGNQGFAKNNTELLSGSILKPWRLLPRTRKWK